MLDGSLKASDYTCSEESGTIFPLKLPEGVLSAMESEAGQNNREGGGGVIASHGIHNSNLYAQKFVL